MEKHLKDLKDLNALRVSAAIDMQDLKDLKKTKNVISRSAGACPPRSFGRPQHGEGQALALRFGGAVWITTKEKAY